MTRQLPKPVLYVRLDKTTEHGVVSEGRVHVEQRNLFPVSTSPLLAGVEVGGGGTLRVDGLRSIDSSKVTESGFTITVWVCPERLQNDGGYVLWVSDQDFALAYTKEVSWDWIFGDTALAAEHQPDAPSGGWYHVAIVLDKRKRMSLHVHAPDGSAIAQSSCELGPDKDVPGILDRLGPLYIASTYGGVRRLHGMVARLRIFQGALEPREILALLQQDVRELSHDALRTPVSALRLPAPEQGQSQRLRSVRPIEPPHPDLGFTLEAWVRPGDTRGRRLIAGFGGQAGWNLAFVDGVLTFRTDIFEDPRGRIVFDRPAANNDQVRARALASDPAARSGPPPALGPWRHVAAVLARQGDTPRYSLYVDGRSVDVAAGQSDTLRARSASDLLVGAEADGSDAFHGLLAELRLWNRALTQTEIELGRQRLASGREWALAALWRASEPPKPDPPAPAPSTAPPTAAPARSVEPMHDLTEHRLHLGPALPPIWELAADLRLLPAGTIIDPEVEIPLRRAELANWRRATAPLQDDIRRVKQTVAGAEAAREASEDRAAKAEMETVGIINAGRSRLDGLRGDLAREREERRAEVARKGWNVHDVVHAVDAQLARARKEVGAEGLYRLDTVSLRVKALPTRDGSGLSFPKPSELPGLPAEALSDLEFDFDSQERIEAAKPRTTEVPDVGGMTEAMARRRLAAARLVMEVAHIVLADSKISELTRRVGTVIEQSPGKGETVPVNSRVTVFLGLGAASGR